MATTLQPEVSLDLAAQLDAALHRGAIARIPDRAFLRVTGPDATRWLNGMVTNSIATLTPGEGCYNFILNAQGRILGDCTIYREPTLDPATYLLQTGNDQLGAIQQHLDKFIIMDDVELNRPEPTLVGILLLGPNAGEILIAATHSYLPTAGAHASNVTVSSHDCLILAPPSNGTPSYEVWFDSSISDGHILRKFQTATTAEISHEALEALRILEGRPRYGTDIRNTDTAHDLPQETGQTHALHFAKGCYLGQEIVERIRSRGKVHRTFSAFVLTGTLPQSGTTLQAEGKPAGELTSVAAIPLATGAVQLALGYVRREALDRNLPLEYPGGTATPIASPYKETP